ncbi:MAG: aminoglycoside phosphotransferase, partial [Betaproteobacteria bacterium]
MSDQPATSPAAARMDTRADHRIDLLNAWLAPQLAREGINDFQMAPASADASFRRYFRITTPAGTRIVMDAPPA